MRSNIPLKELLKKARSLPPNFSYPIAHPIQRVLGSAKEGKKLYVREILEYLENAETAPSDDLDFLLVLCFFDGLDPAYALPVCKLLQLPSQWENENIIDMLGEVGTEECVDSIYHAALRIPDYDDARSYARKCIWALRDIGGAKAAEKLRLLSMHEDPLIREHARTASGDCGVSA